MKNVYVVTFDDADRIYKNGELIKEIVNSETNIGIFSSKKEALKCVHETSSKGYYGTITTNNPKYDNYRFIIQQWELNLGSYKDIKS
jgi:hypothetical protein